MKKPRIGVVCVASQFESGGERAEEIMNGAKAAMTDAGLDVVVASKEVWEASDAIDVCKQFKEEDIESLVIIDITWVTDSMKYLFIHELNLPTMFWAIPYTETFSIGCVQHFGSILKAQGIHYEYVYGLPEDKDLIKKLVSFAKAGTVIKRVKDMRMALLGPRQTWRVAGPQDMTNEEWEFSRMFGPTIAHIDMVDLLDIVDTISDEDAKSALDELLKRTGKVLPDEATMIRMAKVYLATKTLLEKYSLDAIAAECYPQYSGLMNLTSSWLADEGYVIDTEGDISHTVVMHMLNLCAGGGATVLGEVGSFDVDENYLAIAHEGSTAHSMADSLDKVQISPSGEMGSFVGVPIKAMPEVTVATMVGSNYDYKMLIAKGETIPVTREQWVDGGEKLLAHLRFETNAKVFVEEMIEEGMDHHLLIKEGDHTEILSMICDFLGVEKIYI